MELINVDNINSEEEIIAELSNMNGGRKNKGDSIFNSKEFIDYK
jgi:hypothetical protein